MSIADEEIKIREDSSNEMDPEDQAIPINDWKNRDGKRYREEDNEMIPNNESSHNDEDIFGKKQKWNYSHKGPWKGNWPNNFGETQILQNNNTEFKEMFDDEPRGQKNRTGSLK